MRSSSACSFVLLLSACLAGAQSANPVSSSSEAKPGITTAQSPEITQFQKIEDAWSKAVNERDQYALELVLSPLFVDVSASGEITTRNQQLAQVVVGEDKTLQISQRVITVRMLGDIAVANGTYILHHKAGSAVVDEKGVFTHVFERLRGGWVCVNSQRTSLHEEPGGRQKKQGIETPFHIPFLGKGN
jgi:ketosteroid isomerase-like protein